MNKAIGFLTHLTVILSFIFIVFLVLDQFNPMMNFIYDDLSRWLLAGLCLGGIARAILHWKLSGGQAENRQES